MSKPLKHMLPTSLDVCPSQLVISEQTRQTEELESAQVWTDILAQDIFAMVICYLHVCIICICWEFSFIFKSIPLNSQLQTSFAGLWVPVLRTALRTATKSLVA